MNRLQDDIAKTSIQLLLKEPFWGHLLTQIVREFSDETGRMTILTIPGKVFRLIINEKYWTKTLAHKQVTKQHALRSGAIKHQLLHLMFRHISKYQEAKNKRLFGIAADLVVNQFLETDQLLDGAIILNNFSDFKLPINQSAQEIYSILEQNLNIINNQTDDLNPSQEFLLYLLENEVSELDEHKSWRQYYDYSNIGQKIVEDKINKLLLNSKQRTKYSQFGELPDYVAMFVQKATKPDTPTVNWRRSLRLYITTSEKTYLKNTMRRPSKRYGTTPGISLKRKQKMLAVIDTSGSVQEHELQEFFEEIYHVWKTGAEVLIMECDSKIHRRYYYDGTLPQTIVGRGGTNYDEAIRFANSYLPDAFLYFTDGHAPIPQEISRVPLLWLISSNGLIPNEGIWNELQGKKVKMK